MHIPWDAIQLFLAVAEAGSVSAAARRLRVRQPTVSRRLAALERMIGYPLFRRRVTGTALTPGGERLMAAASKMAEWAGEIGRTAEHGDPRPSGLVRLTAAPVIAFHLLAPFAATLRSKEPGLRLEVLSAVELLDLARGEADLAVRVRPPTSADLTVVAAFPFARVVYASRSYAATLPRGYAARDVAWIGYAGSQDQGALARLVGALAPGLEPVFTSDNILVQLAALENGVGAMALPALSTFEVRGRGLVRLRIDLGPRAGDTVHVVAAKSALDIPRIRRTAELLVTELKRHARA